MSGESLAPPTTPNGARRPPRSLAGAAFAWAVLAVAVLAVAPPAAAVEWRGGVETRLRGELFETPEARASQDESYELALARVRLALDAVEGDWTFHGVLQGTAAAGLPQNGAFAIGPVYFGANAGDTTPMQVGVAELSAGWRHGPFSVVLGRQGWTDGMETTTGVPALDEVKRARLAERLVGNWDWVAVGRRYDGVSARFDGGGPGGAGLHGTVFAFRPLAGGVDLDDAFERFDDLDVAGAVLTAERGAWLPATEARLFAIHYDDGRRGAVAAAGGGIDLATLGASVLAGDERRDVLAWLAWQTGDWGPADHSAWAGILEAGWRPAAAWRPHVRVGVAQASGDDAPGGDHRSFFNLLPTNHKWYGEMDYSAFSNLRNAYLDAAGQVGAWGLRAALHGFWLVEEEDAWYGGSGAFEERSLGYAARRPAGGAFPGSHLGWELDLGMSRALGAGWSASAGAAAFFGGEAARALLPAEDDGLWAYLQLVWKRDRSF